MLIFLILVNHFEHLIVYDFHQKAVKQRPKLEYMFSDFFNRYIFTLIFALRVRTPITHHMTSSVSRDVIFLLKTIENILIILNIKFHQNPLVRSSRDIDVLV